MRVLPTQGPRPRASGPDLFGCPASPRLALHPLQLAEQPASPLPPRHHEHDTPDLPAEHEAHGEQGPEHRSPARAKGSTCQAPRLIIEEREVKPQDRDRGVRGQTTSVRPHLIREQHGAGLRGDPERV